MNTKLSGTAIDTLQALADQNGEEVTVVWKIMLSGGVWEVRATDTTQGFVQLVGTGPTLSSALESLAQAE